MLLSDSELVARRQAAAGPLAPLVASLRGDLGRVLDRTPEIPTRKALLSRDGGRCARDGAQLEFDPFSPSSHRCPACGTHHEGERHERAWITWYQLWLVERAVHAAALHAVTHDQRLRELADAILRGYADRYLHYPNRDNVLGPSRPFFSTYLESIWLLYVAVALDLLELAGAADSLSSVVRDRVIEPSAALIASYDEGGSNRQVWNNAALLAASVLLDRRDEAERAVAGRSGVLFHLSTGLLADGSWFEGENYHLFAHRGLWYGVTIAERADVEIPGRLVRRFEEGFATPLATALPDFTFPSRRDSQYAISLRQWRFAESCELGVARTGDRRLTGALHELYERELPRGDTGRWRSTAESERNEPATALSRSDLGWRSLLYAPPELPTLEPVAPRSALLEAQGFAVFRRDGGQVYAALDYGHSGGGHGHPDRLNVMLSVGRERLLDDMGTGSYVDPSLHWYRSTLAHNAPLIDGRSQWRAPGVLRAYEERGGAGWVDAEVPGGGIAPDVRVSRTLVIMTDYVLDQLSWESERDVRVELPIHAQGELQGVSEWQPAKLEGGADPEDGFPFVRDAAVACPPSTGIVRLERGGHVGGDAWFVTAPDATWWRASAPGVPGTGHRPFYVSRAARRSGSITAVWSWTREVHGVERDGDVIRVRRRNGELHQHSRRGQEWHVDLLVGSSRSSITLGGVRPAPAGAPVATRVDTHSGARMLVIPARAVRAHSFRLGAEHYRRSELSWREAGSPEAQVSVGVTDAHLVIEVEVTKQDVFFRPADAPDPALDNEHPDIHSDGVQLYLWSPAWSAHAGWLAVPEPGGDRVRVRPVDGTHLGVPLDARWRETSSGYAVSFRVPISAIGRSPAVPLALDVIVNDMAPGRERRRGQLVLSGAHGGYVYLRGDRQAPGNFLPFMVAGV